MSAAPSGKFSFVRAPVANMADWRPKQQQFPSGGGRLQVWGQQASGERASRAPSWAADAAFCWAPTSAPPCVHVSAISVDALSLRQIRGHSHCCN